MVEMETFIVVSQLEVVLVMLFHKVEHVMKIGQVGSVNGLVALLFIAKNGQKLFAQAMTVYQCKFQNAVIPQVVRHKKY